MRRRMLIVVIALVAVFGSVFGYKAFMGYQIEKFLSDMEPPPATVGVVELDTSLWRDEFQVTAELRAVRGVEVTTEAAGIVRDIAFDSGQTVAEGDLLVTLDLDADKARLDGLRADARLAETTLERKRQLRSRSLGSAADLDQAEAQYQSAAAAVRAQEALIARKTIRAPFDGRLGIRRVDIGQYVEPGTPIVPLQDLDPIYVDFNVPQKQVSRIENGQRVSLKVAGYDQSFQGVVEAVSPALERGTRSFAVRARVDNADERLRPGMYGNVLIEVGTPKPYLTVRQSAISYNPYGDAVWVAVEKDDGLVAERRTVKTGETRADQVQLLAGVEKGDRVIVVGHHKLRAGSRLEIDNNNLPADKAEAGNVDNY